MKPRKQFRVRGVEFVGTQSGPAEDDLQEQLRPRLQAFGVKEAYLAKVRYGDAPEVHVALCLSPPESESEDLHKMIGAVFADMFRQAEHLDVYFLDDERRSQVRLVSQPFLANWHLED